MTNSLLVKKSSAFISSFLVILLTSCNTINTQVDSNINENKNFKINAISDKKIQPKDLEQEYPTPSFDEVPSYSKENIVPGYVNVIYRNDRKVRINKLKKRANSFDTETSNSLNKILEKYGVEEVLDGAGEDEDNNKLDQKERFLSEKAKTEIPHLKSVHIYKFPDDADTIKISEALRKLPFVRTAYPDIKGTTTSFQQLSTQTANTVRYSGLIPNDTYFSYPEHQEWTLFNRHKIFHAWDLYRSIVGGSNMNDAPKPTIAVIDSGFDTGFVGNDRPNYLTGFSVDSSNVTTSVTDCLPSDPIYSTSNPYMDPICHGASMASLIGSPVSNNFGSSGVLPNVPILPIKVKTITGSAIGFAIKRAADSNAQIINVSLSLSTSNNKTIPISFSPTIATQIYYATYTNNKPVVISAGNDKADLDSSTDTILTGTTPCSPMPSCQDKGQVIVGGSSSLGTRWNTSSSKGSSYGKAITLTAYAGFEYFNRFMSYDATASNPISTYGLMGASGTSDSTAIVTGAMAMMIQIGNSIGYNYTASQLRDLVAYTGTPLRSSDQSSQNETKFLGKNLWSISGTPTENVSKIAGMRDLNTYNAISLVYNSSMFNTITRVFNVDDSTQATINANWSSPYTTEIKSNDSFWGTNDYSNPTQLSFRTNNISGKGSFGYQVYRNGLLTKEKLMGVSKVYQTWRSDYLTATPVYDTQGKTDTGYFSSGIFNYTIQ